MLPPIQQRNAKIKSYAGYNLNETSLSDDKGEHNHITEIHKQMLKLILKLIRRSQMKLNFYIE